MAIGNGGENREDSHKQWWFSRVMYTFTSGSDPSGTLTSPSSPPWTLHLWRPFCPGSCEVWQWDPGKKGGKSMTPSGYPSLMVLVKSHPQWKIPWHPVPVQTRQSWSFRFTVQGIHSLGLSENSAPANANLLFYHHLPSDCVNFAGENAPFPDNPTHWRLPQTWI